jgi:hypothetical protein
MTPRQARHAPRESLSCARIMAGALLATTSAAITATAVGLAATSLADTGQQTPNFAGSARGRHLQDRAMGLPRLPAPHPVRRSDIRRWQLDP